MTNGFTSWYQRFYFYVVSKVRYSHGNHTSQMIHRGIENFRLYLLFEMPYRHHMSGKDISLEVIINPAASVATSTLGNYVIATSIAQCDCILLFYVSVPVAV